MTVEAALPFAQYTVAGTGPYAVPWPYRMDTLRLAYVDAAGQVITLTDEAFAATPAESETSGNINLTATAATTYAGKALIITRETPAEQGWAAVFGAREKGMETQLDQIVRRQQEHGQQLTSSLRVAGASFAPLTLGIDQVPMWDGTKFVPGPAADEIANAELNAERAEAAAVNAALGTPYGFNTVLAFLTDNTMGYAPPYANVVTVGQYFLAGGHRYQVAAAGASDHHVQNAGVAKAYVMPSEAGQYAASAFGTNLAKAFEVAARAKRPIVLEGAYIATAALLNIYSGDAELHIVCVGSVTITVDPAAAYIRDLIICQTDSVSSHSVTGGSLTIIGNNKIGSGLTVRHLAASDGGTVNYSCPIKVTGCTKEASGSYEAWGIGILGRLSKITLESPTVEDVTRLSSSGACAGICISGFVGDVAIQNPTTKRILVGSGTTDADGIKTFGYARNGATAKRDGRVRVYGAYFEDCQGRAYKSQCSDDVVYHPVVKRSAAVAVGISQGTDFDFQCGNGRVIGPRVEYYANGGTSPLGSSHTVAAFQALLTDEEMHGRIENLTVISDVEIPRIALAVCAAGTARSVTEVDGVNLIPANGFAATMLGRAVLEVNAAQVVAKTEKTRLSVRGVNGPNTWSLIGYTGYDGSSPLTSKLSWDVTDCNNPLGPAGSQSRAFHGISGSTILAVDQSRQFNLTGYRALYPGAHVVDFRALAAGTVLTVDISTVAATNPPPWSTSGYAHIRCDGGYFGANDRTVWVVKNNASNVWFTQDGGATWGVVK